MSRTILVVEDEPYLREVLDERLRECGHRVVMAPHGLDGLAKLSEHPEIAAIVSDIKMPQMDGIDFIRIARERGYRQPFIFFTAYATREILNQVVKYGVYGFIEKGPMDGLEEAVIASLNDHGEHVIDDLELVLQELDEKKPSVRDI